MTLNFKITEKFSVFKGILRAFLQIFRAYYRRIFLYDKHIWERLERAHLASAVQCVMLMRKYEGVGAFMKVGAQFYFHT